MRHDVEELEHFPEEGAIDMGVNTIRRMSPSSLSLMEIKSSLDSTIIDKMLKSPMLGERIEGKWNIELGREFDMTNDSHLFRTSKQLQSEGWSSEGEIWSKGEERCLPLYEGKMIHQYDSKWNRPKSNPRYWINEKEARDSLLGKKPDNGQKLQYQYHRIGFRDVARNTDERTMIMTVLPPNLYCGHTLSLGHAARISDIENRNRLLLFTALANSFVADYFLRLKVTGHLSFVYLYQIPIPFGVEAGPAVEKIIRRAARLLCVTPDFDEIAISAGLSGGSDDLNSECRDILKAEIDALVANAYGLTEMELIHVLKSFPLVHMRITHMTRNAFRDAQRDLIE